MPGIYWSISSGGRDFIDDEDAYPGLPFTRYFADLIGSGTNVPWEDVL